MAIEIELQNVSTTGQVPTQKQFEQWAQAALQDRAEAILTIRIVDRDESAELNARYRHKPGPTNVLSFPADLPGEIDLPLLGDIVICAPLVAEEAVAQGKTREAHWAHLTAHGVLHLLGYDHLDEKDAEEMEALEISMLKTLGYRDPYQ